MLPGASSRHESRAQRQMPRNFVGKSRHLRSTLRSAVSAEMRITKIVIRDEVEFEQRATSQRGRRPSRLHTGVPFTYSFDRLTPLAGSIRDEALPRVAPAPLCPGSAAARCVVRARPWSRISESGSRCSSRRIPTESLSDAVRQSPRHDQGIPVGSIQSRVRHRRSAKAARGAMTASPMSSVRA